MASTAPYCGGRRGGLAGAAASVYYEPSIATRCAAPIGQRVLGAVLKAQAAEPLLDHRRRTGGMVPP